MENTSYVIVLSTSYVIQGLTLLTESLVLPNIISRYLPVNFDTISRATLLFENLRSLVSAWDTIVHWGPILAPPSSSSYQLPLEGIKLKKYIHLFVHFALPKTPSVTTQLELDVQYQGAKSPVSKSPFFTIFSKEMYRIYLLLKICTELTFRCRYACCGGRSCCCNCKMKN